MNEQPLPRLLPLPSFSDARGSLTVAEQGRDFDWEVAGVAVVDTGAGDCLPDLAAPAFIVPLRGSVTLEGPGPAIRADSPSQAIAVADMKGCHTGAGNAMLLIIWGTGAASGPSGSTDRETALPFQVKRVFWLHNLPEGSSRGAHAHRTHHQLIMAACGSFNVTVDDGRTLTQHRLRAPGSLWVKPGIWNTLGSFSEDAVCVVLASEKYDERLYMRDYNEFRKFAANNR